MSASEYPPVVDVDIGETTRTSIDDEMDLAKPDLKNQSVEPAGFSAKWTLAINSVRQPILEGLKVITRIAATNPKRTVYGIAIFSLAIFVLGLFTNFELDTDEDTLWTPDNSKPILHKNWIDDESGFPIQPRSFFMMFHSDGENVLGEDEVGRIFQALDAVRGLPDYASVCAADPDGDCPVFGATRFWGHSSATYEALNLSDEEVIAALSEPFYPDGTPVSESNVFGTPVRDDSGQLTSALSYSLRIDLPDTEDAENFETDALDVILDMDDAWQADSSTSFRVEVSAERSFSDEFERAIVNDIPLVPIVFIIMGIFTAAYFYRRDPVQSRSLLGFAAVVSVLLSIMTGYGLMFVCGVAFTSMTQILPFVIFGVGLDDAFIISGSYARTDPSKDTVERILDTVEDVGLSVTLTTITSTLAFGLGCLSTVPAVFSLCLYAFPTIFVVFFYQLTFFIGAIVLDEKRIKDRRRDCLTCCTVANYDESANFVGEPSLSLVDRAMGWYAKKLLQSWVKVLVLLLFAGLFALCVVSTTKLSQKFEFTDVVPDGSYITDFFDASDAYTVRSAVDPGVYFRFVDQSDPSIQEAMETYVNELVEIDAIIDPPEFFWLTDFKQFVADEANNVGDLSFNLQVDAFLNDTVYNDLYADHIVRDEAGSVIESRCIVYMDNIDLEDVTQQIDALEDQQAVSRSQPINEGKSEWAFFTYQQTYLIWSFYDASVEELTFTTIMGVVSVTGVALVFIPHWTAAFFVLPLICVLYINLLGFMQWFGVSINAVSYVTLVMSIGLLVDFVMHVLLRYYESPGNRYEKTVDMLQTMGASILVGSISTFLGTLPLAFSSSEIFSTVFVAFLGLVLMGASHGLILLPVVLSIIGPEDQIVTHNSSNAQKAVKHQETRATEDDEKA